MTSKAQWSLTALTVLQIINNNILLLYSSQIRNNNMHLLICSVDIVVLISESDNFNLFSGVIIGRGVMYMHWACPNMGLIWLWDTSWCSCSSGLMFIKACDSGVRLTVLYCLFASHSQNQKNPVRTLLFFFYFYLPTRDTIYGTHKWVLRCGFDDGQECYGMVCVSCESAFQSRGLAIGRGGWGGEQGGRKECIFYLGMEELRYEGLGMLKEKSGVNPSIVLLCQ